MRRPIHIPAQALSGALQTLGRERGVQIVYRSDVVGYVRSQGAVGELNLDEAIAQLLDGTGLTYRHLDERTITIVPLPAGSPGVNLGAAHSSESRQEIELEEVIVTAQKVVEVASKIPLALSVHSGASLKEQGVVNVSDLQDIALGLSVGRSPAGVNIAIRGVTTTDNTSKGDQGIVFNIDGISLGRPREMGLALFDLERVEVLRGPQGTLYGKSSTGGVINAVTNKPKDAFGTAASLEFGNYNIRRGDAMVNVPITDSFALRAAANFNVRDGYLDPVLNNYQSVGASPARMDENDRSGRLSGLWTISDTANLLLTGTFGHVGGVGPATAIVNTGPLSAHYRPVAARSGPAALDVYYNPFGSAIDQNFQNYNAELRIIIDAVRIDYAGAKLWFDAHDVTSTTSNPEGRNNNYGWTNYQGTYDTDSHELRFSNVLPSRVDWVAGVNYYSEKINERDQSYNSPMTNPAMATSVNATGILADTGHTSYGVFSQVNLHATDNLKFTVGVRWSSDSVRRRNTTFAAGPGPAPGVLWLDEQGQPCVAPNNCVGTPRDGDQADSKVTYRLGADYRLDDNQMLYFVLATGYKAGGFNDFDLYTGEASSLYDSEQLTDYEAGYKVQVLPNLQLNSVGFYYDYSKNQVSSAVNINGVGVLYTRTVPSTIYGWENELNYKISKADSIDARLSFEKSRYKSLTVGFNYDIDWSGYSLDRTPAVTAMLAYAHRWFMADGSNYEARVSSRYKSGYYISDLAVGTQYKQQSFTRSDFSLAYNSAAGKFNLQAYILNIENDLQVLNAPQNVNSAVDSANAAISEPRMFGIRLGVKY